MIHRAVLGSLERFIAILLEHTAGKLPLWLAPVQVRVLPVSEKVEAYARGVAQACRAAGLRAEADLRNEKLDYKIREAQLEKIPVLAVVGEREAADGTVAPRIGGRESGRQSRSTPSSRARGRMPASQEVRHSEGRGESPDQPADPRPRGPRDRQRRASSSA